MTTEEQVQSMRKRLDDAFPHDVALASYERLLLMEILLEVKHLLVEVTQGRITYTEPLDLEA